MATLGAYDSESFPALLPFLSLFLATYLVGYFVLFRNWGPKTRPECSSCLMSLVHGTPAAFFAAAAILADPNRGFAAANTKFQKLVLDYSVAYFVMDLLHYLVFFPGDVLFIGHHLATVFVISTCRHVVSQGAFAVLFVLILAEVTSACQNAWTLARARRREDPFAAQVYDVLSPLFYAFYSVVRGLAAPYFLYEMVVFYVGGGADGLIPRWVWISWVVVVLIGLVVSIMWVSDHWVQLYRERTRKLGEKIK